VSENFVDFRIVKERVSMQAVLDHYNIRLRRSNQTSLRGACPLPTHRSETSKESFGVQTAKNIWACQSASCASSRGGKKGGNVIDFVAIMDNCSVRDAALKLHDWFVSTRSTAEPVVGKGSHLAEQPEKLVAEKRGEGSDDAGNKPLSFTLKDIDPTHPYVRQRGLKEETARHFGVGFFPGRGSMSQKCVVPIHNDRGELIAYAGRSVDGSEPKYKLPAGFKKSDVLFNLHRARLAARSDTPMIVVEGFFDCMKVHQAGFPVVVGLMGSSMSDTQQNLLATWPRVILLLDGDAAGREGALAIAPRLMARSFVKVINLADGKQPDQLSSDEIKTLLAC
jgi:DNA primase